MYTCGTRFRLSLHTCIINNKAQIASHPPPPPPSPFVFFSFHAFIFPSVVCLPPPSRLLSAFTTDPPERGLMRANDGNACCCFPFINGSTLAYRTQLFIISSLRSARRVFPPFHLSPLRSVSRPPPLSSLKWSGFSSFSSIYTHLPCLRSLSYHHRLLCEY